MNNNLNNYLFKKFGGNIVDGLYDIISKTITNWCTIKQLYSLDKTELISGLQKVINEPFIEAKERLYVLEKQYEYDIYLYTSIKAAIEAVKLKYHS